MDYVIEIKQLPPTRVLTTNEQIPYANLQREVSTLLKFVDKRKTDNHITQVYQPELKFEAMTRPCCPVAVAFTPIDKTKYHFEVLPRCKVVSAIHKGEYDKFDEAMELLAKYMEEHNLKASTPIRVIHHKGGAVYKLFKTKEKDYVAEVQIPFEE